MENAVLRIMMGRTHINKIRVTHDKATVFIIQRKKNLDIISLKPGIGRGCSLSPLVFNIVVEALARKNKTIEGNERYTNKEKKLNYPYHIIVFRKEHRIPLANF